MAKHKPRFKKSRSRTQHQKGLEVLAGYGLLRLRERITARADSAGSDAAGLGNLPPAEAVIWALNQSVNPPYGLEDSITQLGINTDAKWESLANDLHTARNSYVLNGMQTRSKLPAVPGDTVSALISVVESNS